MATKIYLGEPPANIKQWIIDHYTPVPAGKLTKMTYSDSSVVESNIIGTLKASDLGYLYTDWAKITENLEDYPNKSSELPAVGSYVSTAYDMDVDDTVQQEFQVMGYNASIPEYVKYKNGDNRIYVSSLKSGLLAPIAANDTVYTKSGSVYTATSDKVSSVSGSFTYGNNCTYDVPTSIVVNGTTYTFAGYNMTLLSKLALGVKHDGVLYTYAQFDSVRNDYGQNDWSTSMLRSWMNGTGDTSRLANQKWYQYSGSKISYGNIVMPLYQRYSDSSFDNAIVKTVNRTWTYLNWRTSDKKIDSATGCEHVVDKFWLLGMGSINCTGKNSSGTLYFPDANYDTSKFSAIWPTSKTAYSTYAELKRNCMNTSGEDSGTPCFWRLRSADSVSSSSVGDVYNYGLVSYDIASYDSGVLPACTIG